MVSSPTRANVRSYVAEIAVSPPISARIAVKSYEAMVAVSPPAAKIQVKSFLGYVAVRADHKNTGGAYAVGEIVESEETDLIYSDIIFPLCISYGSTGSPEYLTEKIEVDSGAEKRNQRRAYPKHKYKIKMENLPANEVSEIMNIWHVCAGDFIGFLYLDTMDHTSVNTDDVFSGTDVTKLDQLVAPAIGSQSKYPLFKYYKRGSRIMKRRIRYPDLSTLVVAVDGVLANNWTYSYTDQMLTFTKGIVASTFTLSRASNGIITGANFSGLKVGELVYINGWSDASYNSPLVGTPARVVIATSTQLKVEKYDGSQYGSAVLGPSSVTVDSALPPTGSNITAGFYFYTPVRFGEGDNMEYEIKSGMRETVIADYSQITLIEIFE